MNTRAIHLQAFYAAIYLMLPLVWGCDASVVSAAPAAKVVTPSQIAQAKIRMKRFLLSKQDGQSGSWETRTHSDSQYYGHTTALVTYSLLQSGLSYQAPSLTKAVDFLTTLKSGDAYTLYPKFLCWSILPDQFNPNLNADARMLMRAQQEGLFRNENQTDKSIDARMLLYGVIGLHVASERGVSITPQTWERITNHLLGVQHNSGGWGDNDTRSSDSSVSATISAMTVLHICKLQLAGYPSAMGPITSSLQRAERYLARNWSMALAADSLDKTHSYEAALYSLYQLAMLTRYSGVQTYGGQDWFRQGIQTVLQLEGGRGSIRGDMIETAFALLILSQADVSVWLNRLELPGPETVSRAVSGAGPVAGDVEVYQLTRHISSLREYDLHWQIVRPDDPLTVWLTAPMLYVSSDEPLELTDEQQGRVKRYLDAGGLLIACPQNYSRNSSQLFTNSVIALAKSLYPDLSFNPLQPGHPATSLLLPVEGLKLQSLSTGARDLIILSDVALVSASALTKDALPSDPNQMNTTICLWYNLYAWTSDRGVITTRMETWLDVPSGDEPTHRLTLVRASCSDVSTSEQEMMAWPLYGIRLRNSTGIELTVRDLPLTNIGSCNSALVHLAGMKDQSLTDTQKQAIVEYLQRGGTLLVESVGGRNGFARSIRLQLEEILHAPAIPLSKNAAVFQPQPMLKSGVLQRTPFRTFSVLNHSYAPFPRLTTIEFQGRQAVFFSDDDLTLGLLRLRRWGINGYRPKTADAIVSHLLAWTAPNSEQMKQSALAQQSAN